MAVCFTKGGQTAWFHDEGDTAGFFHTYDAMSLSGKELWPHKVHVFLPRDYEETGQRYGVLYMNDGHTVFFPGGYYYRTWNLADKLAELYCKQTLAPILVVAVCPVDRNCEYTHARWNDAAGCCRLPEYADYLVNTLKPFIDGCYRTLPGRAMHAGASHGGLAAFYTGLRYPGIFNLVAALSPSFWVGLDDADDFPLVKARPEQRLEKSALLSDLATGLADSRRPALYLDWGLVRGGGPHNSHIEALAAQRGREMAELLASRHGYCSGKTLFAAEISDGDHTECSWRGRLDTALRLWPQLD